MKIIWKPTSRELYGLIYSVHHNDLCVHESFTRMGDEEGGGETRLLTAWGFEGADAPLIKSECRGTEWSFYIAVVSNEVE